MSFVIDASIAVAWCFEDQSSPAVDALLDRVRAEGAIAPSLWHLELANLLLMAEKRGRITGADTAARLDLISALPVSVDHATAARAWRETMTLARAQKLTAYEAAYLELAVRRNCPLATRDKALKDAALRAGVQVLP